MEIDSILDKLGRIGKFQILMYVFCGLQGISFPVWDMLSVTSFMAPSPEYSCVSWQSEDENGGKYMERVALNHTVYNGECEDGEEIVFNLDTYGRTLVTEWKLVGDEAVLVELSQSLFMVGMMVGSIVLGQMSDSFGRKPILIICASLSPLLGLASGFVPNMWSFIAIRILIGFICPGAILSSYVLALELFPSKKRAAASILLSSFNAIAYVSLATLAFFIKDWRYLQISTSAFRILLVPFCLFVPESIQWLAAKGKHEKLEQLLQKIATINKIDLAFPILADINKSDQTDGTTSDSDLPLKESDKSDDDRLFMYDSAVSLDDRDYIPAEDNYSLDNYSSDSETEEAAHSASGYLSVSRSSSSNLAAHHPRNGLSYPGHCERVNLYPVNSSISILSELREESELLASYDDLYQQRHPGTQIPCLPKKTLERSQEKQTNKPLRKKSISLCHIPSFVTFESEIRSGNGVVGNKLSADHHRLKEKSNVMKTVSIPNITVNPSKGTAVPGIEAACPPDRGALHGSKVNRKPANLTITTNEDAGSSFLLSVPTLALPFGYSQNLFPNAGNQYEENVESSQSEEEEGWLRDDTSGFNSSTSNVAHLSDYESLEEGYGKKHGKDGYSELKKSTKADNKTVKKERGKKAYTALDLFRMSSVRLITVSSMTIWFATYSVYVGLSMSTDALAGDPYINFSLVGLVEIPAVIVAALSAVRIGRRFPSGVFHFLTALSCCVYLVLPIENDSTWSSMISVVAILFAKCFTSAAYNVECLLTAEVLPTPLSTTAFASVQTVSIEVTDKLAKTTTSSSSSSPSSSCAVSIWWSSNGFITFITTIVPVIG